MKKDEKRWYNRSRGKEYWLPCPKCNNTTSHIVLSSVDLSGDTEILKYWEEYQVVECNGCKTLSFRKNWQTTEDVSMDKEGNEELIDHVELYPPRIAGRPALKDTHLLPYQVRGVY